MVVVVVVFVLLVVVVGIIFSGIFFRCKLRISTAHHNAGKIANCIFLGLFSGVFFVFFFVFFFNLSLIRFCLVVLQRRRRRRRRSFITKAVIFKCRLTLFSITLKKTLVISDKPTIFGE